ncbi:alpha/beta fold hydrolase [Streptomyces sp. NPDC056983]|uniref:alpha/beta fold hydrolase n=1 Tax=Streptomyces sp. NPDC056983 TaxID=3345987 RepID=UPI0036386620
MSPAGSRRRLPLARSHHLPVLLRRRVKLVKTNHRPPFVLVHGGRHGGWCWKRLTPLLHAAGHQVYTPTLTGLGERSHLLHADVGLDTHIRDVVAVFECEDLQDVVLVAHSYAGMVVTGAMEQISDRVRQLVFLDAHMPRAGESALDLSAPGAREQLLKLASEQGEGWYIPPGDSSFWGLSDPEDIAWVNGKITAQPLKTYTDPVGHTDRAWAHPGMFIECRNPADRQHAAPVRPFERSATDTHFHYRQLDAAHDAMVTAPSALASILFEAAALDIPKPKRRV